jgi:uncharacterized membrane protein YedE/YeeE
MQGAIMSGRLKWMKVVWVACSLGVFLATLLFYDGTPNSAADLILALGMLTLSFPSGILLSALVGLVGRMIFEQTGAFVTSSYLWLTISWLALFGVGYWQWFILIPWVAGRWTRKRKTLAR